jgi:hypothetical protein
MSDRPNLTDARVAAGTTYKRRRARTAADELLSIPPDLWDDHTRRVILVTLPSLVYARELARYGEPRGETTCSRPACGNPPCVDCTSAGIPCDGCGRPAGVECRAHCPTYGARLRGVIAGAGDPPTLKMHDNGDYRA